MKLHLNQILERERERERRREKRKEERHYDGSPKISAIPIAPGLDLSASATPFWYLFLSSLNLLSFCGEFHECIADLRVWNNLWF